MRTTTAVGLLLAWLVAVALLDTWTHPYVVVGVMYLPAVALVAWRWGWRWALPLSVACIGFHIWSDAIYLTRETPDLDAIHINESLVGLLVVLTAGASANMAQQQATIRTQRDDVTRLRDQMSDEMSDARRLQDVVFGPLPVSDRIDIAKVFRPARILGGDAVKVVAQDDVLLIALGDVSGKGTPAALASSVLLGLLSEAPYRTERPQEVLRFLNVRLAGTLGGEKFVTLAYMVLRLSDGLLTYASAGHEPFLLVRDGKLQELAPTGLILGVLPDADYTQTEVQLLPGDLVFGYTDGITDAVLPTGDHVGFERVQQLLLESPGASASDTVESVVLKVLAMASDTPDDIALLAFRWK